MRMLSAPAGENAQTLPVATLLLIAANVLIWLYQSTLPPDALAAFFAAMAAVPANLANAFAHVGKADAHVWASSVTSLFVHANAVHLAGNMMFLWAFGPPVESATGRLRFLLLFCLAGALAEFAFAIVFPRDTSQLIGASGAISGVMAGYMMFRPCVKVPLMLPGIVPQSAGGAPAAVPAYWAVGSWIAFQIVHAAQNSGDGVAYVSHVGGFFAGCALFPVLKARNIKLFQCIRPDRQ